MTTPDLVMPDDLESFPGGPFDASVVESAANWVRSTAGWHIAPEITETVTLDSSGDPYLVLPTLKLSEVSAVRDVTDPDFPVTVTGWAKSRSKAVLYRRRGWPCGFEALEVDLVHGYEECPPELLPVIAERCQVSGVNRSVSQEQSGQEMVTYVSQAGGRVPRELRRYQLPKLP